jgi:hypothetical protein
VLQNGQGLQGINIVMVEETYKRLEDEGKGMDLVEQ